MKTKFFWIILLVFVIFLGGAFYFMGKSDDGTWNFPRVTGGKITPKPEVKIINKIYEGDSFTFEYSPDYILEDNTLWTPELYEVMSTATPECETCYWGGISIGYNTNVDFELGTGNETIEQIGKVFNVTKVSGNRFTVNGNPEYNYGYLVTMDKFEGLIYYVQYGTKVVFFQIDGNNDLLSRATELRSLVETVKFTE